MPTTFTPGGGSAVGDRYKDLLTQIQRYTDTVSRLRRQLSLFPEQLDAAAKRFEFIERSVAESIREQATRLLEYCDSNPSAEAVPYVLAAIDYFLFEIDARPDFAEVGGFDDDAKVIEDVIRHFGLEEHMPTQSQKRGE